MITCVKPLTVNRKKMTPKEFAAFLESPESDKFSVEQVENLLKQYPYSQSLRIAFLKKLRLSNHPDFEKHLHKTATYAYDRVFLKRYINKELIYVIEYPSMKVEVEQLETLELMPLDKLQSEKVEHSIFNNIADVPEQKQQLTFPSENWEEAVEDELEIRDDFFENEEITTEEVVNEELEDIEETIENEVVEEITTEEVVNEESEDIKEAIENEVVEVTENEEITTEEVVNEESEYTEETIENEVVEATENEEIVTEKVVNEKSEDIEEAIENEVVEATENGEIATEEVINEESEDIEETIENEDEITEEKIEENVEEIVENEIIDENEEPMKNSTEATSKSELQNIILESKKMEEHAPIEEDIDNLLHEDVLETLDDEIEFGFEIDKNIINDQDDFSLFDYGEHEHHHDDDGHHHEEKHHDDDVEHHKEETKKPLSQLIHEQINESDNIESITFNNDEIGISEHLEEEKIDLSPDNIFSKDELIEEGGLYFLDVIEETENEEMVDESVEEEEKTTPSTKPIQHLKTTLIETEKDPEELPLEEEEDVIPSTENVDEIRATLLNNRTDKQTKKQQVKLALQRISKISLNEIGVITETYGDLLAKQGKIEHAIRLYQQLILKNPQKKVYFAAKIKQLIKKI